MPMLCRDGNTFLPTLALLALHADWMKPATQAQCARVTQQGQSVTPLQSLQVVQVSDVVFVIVAACF